MMKRLVAVVLVAAFAAGFAVMALGQRARLQRPLVLSGAAATSPLLGVHYRRGEAWLVRLDPKTLKIRPGRRLALDASSVVGWCYSPERRLLALGNDSSTQFTYYPARVRLVDTRALRKVRAVSLHVVGDAVATHWPAPNRLLALVRSREDPGNGSDAPVLVDRVVVVDPSTRAVLATHKLTGRVTALARTTHALVLVLVSERYGPVRLVVADMDGGIASVALDRVHAGLEETPGGPPRQRGAAIAVDEQAGRTYVLARADPVAEVALATLAVGYHSPTQPVSVLGRLHDWLEPSAQAKVLDGSWRSATWLGDGRLAVFGRDASTYPVGDRLETRERPSGLLVIDTRTWNAHMVDPSSSALVVAKNVLLSWGSSWDSGTQRMTGAGLNVYDQTGIRRFHLFGARAIFDVQVVGRRAFVDRGTDGRYAIVDIRTGREVRTIRGRAMPLVLSGKGAPFFG
jgi:hypothetical protein